MKIDQVAAQLYSIRDYIKTPADVSSSLKKIKKIGYCAVQVSGMGPIPEADLVEMLNDEGLVCAATHEGANTILDEPHKVVDRLKKLDCRYTAYPHPAGIDLGSESAVLDLARRLNSAGRVLHDAGLVLTYHNHSGEFRKVNGKTVLETIYNTTDKQYLQGEPDTYWIQAGGGNPVQWCEKLAGRIPLLHLKDYGMDNNNTAVFREIGNGNLDWPAIIAMAEKGGCRWFIIEQDGNWLNNDPFESLHVSFEYVRKNLVL